MINNFKTCSFPQIRFPTSSTQGKILNEKLKVESIQDTTKNVNNQSVLQEKSVTLIKLSFYTVVPTCHKFIPHFELIILFELF